MRALSALFSGTYGGLSVRERYCVALVAARPRAMATFDSAALARSEAITSYQRLVRGLSRRGHHRRPLLYFAVPSCGIGATGYHIHALFWSYVHWPVLHAEARRAGFGAAWIRPVTDPIIDLRGAVSGVAYVLGQDEAVFGTTAHQRHRPLPRYKRWHLMNQKRTAQRNCSQLFDNLEMAKDKAVPDDELLERLPLFSEIYKARFQRTVQTQWGETLVVPEPFPETFLTSRSPRGLPPGTISIDRVDPLLHLDGHTAARCLYCSTPLDGLRKDARYCSPPHRAAAWRERHQMRT
jgi:hypothetical protein